MTGLISRRAFSSARDSATFPLYQLVTDLRGSGCDEI